MAKYSGKPVVVTHPAEEVYNRLSDLSSFQQRLETLPPEAREKLGDVRFTADSIIITAPAVGEMKFVVSERTPFSRLGFAAENSPVPFAIKIDMKPVSDTSTEVMATIDVDIPVMLKPLVGGKMQEAADKFSEMLSTLFAS